MGVELGSKERDRLLLTAKATSRNKFWKGQPAARRKRTQRAVWRTRAPILKTFARKISI